VNRIENEQSEPADIITHRIDVLLFLIFNARKMAKKFNETVRATGKEPW
jgi:hypothetical protein